MIRQRKRLGNRPKAFWGSLIPSLINSVANVASGIITTSAQARAQKRALEQQEQLAQQQAQISRDNQLANTLNNSASADESYANSDQYNLKYRNGGTKRIGDNNIVITDGGNAKRIGRNTYLLRGGSHETINSTGQTGIGINVGGNEIEAEGGEVAQRKGNSLRIYSAQPILGGISPAQAVMKGYNKDAVFNAQQRFKKNNSLKDDGSKAAFGNLITMPDIGNRILEYFTGTGRYADKPVKVSNKTVAKKPIKNGQVGNFRVVNGRRIPNEKSLQQVSPEYDLITLGQGLPLRKIGNTFGRAVKNTVGFVSKPNTFTRGIGGREGIRDLVESKVVRGNPVGTEMTAKAYTKATKYNRNKFNDIMNGIGRKGISHRYYNRSLSKDDFNAIKESYNKVNESFIARNPKASGHIRFAISDNVYNPLGGYKDYDDYVAKIARDRKTLSRATTLNPDNGEPIAYFYNDGRNPLTKGHGYAASKWGVRINNPQDYNMKIFNNHLHYSNSKSIPFNSPNVEVFRKTPFGTIRYPKWALRRGWYRYGGSTSKDKGSFKHSYPRITLYEEPVDYPEPTKDELINALSVGGVPGTDSYKPRRYKGGVDSESPLALLNILHYLDIASGMTDENGNSKYITGVAPSAGRAVNMGRTLANVEKGIQATNKLANTIRNSRNIVTTKPISTSNLGLPEVPTPRSYKDYFKGLGININKATRASKPYNGYARPLEASKPYTPYSGAVISQPITPNPYTGRLEFGSRIDRLNSAFARLRQSGKSIKNKVTNPNTYRTATTAERVRDANGRLVWKQNYKLKPWVKGALGTAGVGAGAGLVYGLSKVENKDSKLKTQLDAHGQPISSYIARPQEPVRQQSKPQTNRSVPVRRDTVRTDTTKQVNKVVPRQTKNISQYKGNTTKGNYQLYDGETKVINGTKYTRKGNTIINHKTNVGYIYDKNGNYTGQADYSKVGNFNQAFDSARAAGRNNFIYRAGKYQNYSTVKETDVKKEALNRRIGAKRIAKRFGDSLPVEGMRPKAVNGTWARPYKYSYEDTNNNAFLNKVKSNGLLYKSNSVTSANTPYLGRQSEFKPATQDYIGLGIDTLAALGSGLFTRSAYNNLDFDYSLPNYVDETPVSFDTTYHNEAQRANIERNRINARNIIGGNTASAQDALTRMQQSDTNALMESNKLLDEKSNKEVELRNQNAANEQAVRARNAAARNQYYQNVATIKNAALQAKNEASLAKAQSVASDLSGLSQAWTNFATSVENRYNNRQNEAIIAATSKEPAVLSNAIQFGYNFSPEILANVYKNTNDDKLKRLALSRLSNSERRKFGII